MTKIAYHPTGTRAASKLTYAQWQTQNDRNEKAISKAINAKEVNKYAGPRK